MANLDVKIVTLDALHVASAKGFGTNPEEQAVTKLRVWADANGGAGNLKGRRFFGFNNPQPAPGRRMYGYEQWMTVDAAAAGTADVEIKDFSGGTYAVTRTSLRDVARSWSALAEWAQQSGKTLGKHQWLEECLTPELFMGGGGDVKDATFDIYLPLAGE